MVCGILSKPQDLYLRYISLVDFRTNEMKILKGLAMVNETERKGKIMRWLANLFATPSRDQLSQQSFWRSVFWHGMYGSGLPTWKDEAEWQHYKETVANRHNQAYIERINKGHIMNTLNLYQRINEIRKKIDYIKKDKSVSTGGGSYKAVTHDQVTALVRDHMVEFGVVCYPILVASLMNPKEVNANMETAKQARYEATYDFVFVNIEAPEDKLTIRIESHAMDNADKAPGKALSYAKKYAILKLFEIETGEDEESRYQEAGLSDERIEVLISRIKLAQTDDEKKSQYKLAVDECRQFNDVEAANKIKAALS